jgi:death on curing protein
MSGDEPRFLCRDDIDEIHHASINKFGGSHGVRDSGLIDSALGSAKNAWYYGGGDVFDIAAAYAFHIAESQAFIDGNKRTALGAALVFLDRNGHYRSDLDHMVLYNSMIALADHRLDKAGLAALFREWFSRS